MKNLYWRGESLWCWYFNFEGKQVRKPTGLKRRSRTKAETEKVIRQACREILPRIDDGTIEQCLSDPLFFDIHSKEPESKEYNPYYLTIAQRFWYFKLSHQDSGKDAKSHLMASIKKFGCIKAKEIKKTDVEVWLNELKDAKVAINTINNYLSYMKLTFGYANDDKTDKEYLFDYDPLQKVSRLSGAKKRQFVLTEWHFERNHKHLLKCADEQEKVAKEIAIKNPTSKAQNVYLKSADSTRKFAKFYFGLWSTGRRPKEVAQYEWSMLQRRPVLIDGEKVLVLIIKIPNTINKTDSCSELPVPPKLEESLMQTPPKERTGYLWENISGGKWTYWRHHMDKLKEEFGEDAGWARDNRRGFATYKVEVEKCEPKHIQDIGGWATDHIFKTYSIGSLENKAKAMGYSGKRLITNLSQKGALG